MRYAEDVQRKNKAEKLWRYRAMLKKVDTFQDGLGLGVDREITKTVALFNLLGFRTIMSCEGHLTPGHGEVSPWVDSMSKGREERTACESSYAPTGNTTRSATRTSPASGLPITFRSAADSRGSASRRGSSIATRLKKKSRRCRLRFAGGSLPRERRGDARAHQLSVEAVPGRGKSSL